jgi:hypothetical protein
VIAALGWLDQFGWTEGIAVVALGISLVSIALAVRPDRRSGRAERRAESAERRDEERAEREREQAGTGDRALIAKLHLLVEDIRPGPLLHLADLDQERATRAGHDLWRRWRELKEPLHVFASESGPGIADAVKDAATHLALSLQATRNAIGAADDPPTRASAKQSAVEAYEVAMECVDDLDCAFAGRSQSGLLKSERRRA